MSFLIKQLDFEKKKEEVKPEPKQIIGVSLYEKTFEGVNILEMQNALEMRDRLKKEKTYENEKKAKLDIAKITSDGQINVDFNQDLLAPENQLEQFQYQKLLIFSIKS